MLKRSRAAERIRLTSHGCVSIDPTLAGHGTDLVDSSVPLWALEDLNL